MDGRLRGDFDAALRAVFNRDTLERWLDYTMDVRLDDVTPPNVALPITVHKLIEWAESSGRLDELIGKAGKANPDHPLMKAFIAAWQEAAARPQPAPARPAPAPAAVVDAGALRRAMAGAFSVDELEQLCAEVEDELRKQGIDEPLSLDIVGASGGLQNKILALVKYLDRRGRLPALVVVVRRLRAGVI